MSFALRKCGKCNIISESVENGLCVGCNLVHGQAVFVPAKATAEDLAVAYAKMMDRVNAHQTEVKPAVAGKPSISLIPREAIFEMARSFDYGTSKHGRYAFRDGVEFTKLIDAALRHLHAIADGEDIDTDSADASLLHAGNAMSNLAMLIFMMKHKQEFDDRWKK